MNLSFWFARKYFYSKKSKNVINAISLISQIGITICAAALVIILSVYNGLEDLMIDLYSTFDSDIKILPEEGKYFDPDSIADDRIMKLEGYLAHTEVIEENALIQYKNEKIIAAVKAITPDYVTSLGMDSMIVYGDLLLEDDDVSYAVLGVGIASKLDLGYFDYSRPLHFYYPSKSKSSFRLNPESAFQKKYILPAGVFAIQEEYDNKYALVPIEFMRALVKREKEVTAVEINFKEGTDLVKTKAQLEQIIGPAYRILNRDEQHASFYKITRLEKFMTFIILSFILLIAAFNLIGSLLMLSLEKKRDMMVLKSMGAQPKTIRNIFFFEGTLLSLSSAVIGILIGVTLVLLQMFFGFIKLGGNGSTFIVDAYPVALRGTDLLFVFLVVILIGFISSYLPARSAGKDVSIQDIKQ